MILYNQHLFPGCSSLAKLHFALTVGQRRKREEPRGVLKQNLTGSSSPKIGQWNVIVHYVASRRVCYKVWFNWTSGSTLRILLLKEKHKWPKQIQTLTFAFNAAVHETTGYAPFQLMFGRVPRLPVDAMFRQVLHDPAVVDHGMYLKS